MTVPAATWKLMASAWKTPNLTVLCLLVTSESPRSPDSKGREFDSLLVESGTILGELVKWEICGHLLEMWAVTPTLWKGETVHG